MLIEALLRAYRRVSPPVATMVAFAAIGTAVPVDTCIAWAPTQAPSLSASSVTSRSPTRCTSGMRCTRARKVFETAGPVLRKSTYTQRLRSWPGAWTCARCPSRRAQPMPHSSISRMHAGPCSQRRRESAGSQRPRPAFRVSARWCSQWSGSSSPTATATVICAITVAPPRPIRLRSTSSTLLPARAAVTAAYMPAAPDPMTRTSACSIEELRDRLLWRALRPVALQARDHPGHRAAENGKRGPHRDRDADDGDHEAQEVRLVRGGIEKHCELPGGEECNSADDGDQSESADDDQARHEGGHGGNVAASPGPFKALLLFDRLLLDGLELIQ